MQKRETENSKQLFIPFEPTRKRSLQAHIVDGETVRIVLKGAPEKLLPMCTQFVDGDGNVANQEGEWAPVFE